MAKDTEYYVMPTMFKNEICKGLDYRVVCRLLVQTGALIKEGESFQKSVRLPSGERAKVYRITSKIFDDTESK